MCICMYTCIHIQTLDITYVRMYVCSYVAMYIISRYGHACCQYTMKLLFNSDSVQSSHKNIRNIPCCIVVCSQLRMCKQVC